MTARFLLAGAAVPLLLASGGVSGCYGRNDVTAPDDILLVTASPASIPADGVSTSTIEARVHPQVDRELTIKFTTSAGRVASENFHPDSNGRATTFLTSSTTPQTALVTVNIGRANTTEASRTIPVIFERADSSSVIRLTLSSTEIPADGASSVQVRADVNPGVTPRTVKFETTAGSFSPDTTTRTQGDVATDANGVARTLLYAPRAIGTALVTVTGGMFSASNSVSFVRALPDSLTLRAAPLAISKSETQAVTVTATLARSLGKVTENAVVIFSIESDATRQPFGRFQNVKRSTLDQEASADFVSGAAAPSGLATITARVQDTPLSASVKITVIDPLTP
jgi:hypothetical protein